MQRSVSVLVARVDVNLVFKQEFYECRKVQERREVQERLPARRRVRDRGCERARRDVDISVKYREEVEDELDNLGYGAL